MVNRAAYHTRLACNTYDRLVRLARQIPYRKDVIRQLKAFDYNTFMTDQGLNAAVFARVGEYLERGDITGTFRHTRANLASLASLLTEVKNNLLSNRLPELAVVWQLNETAADAALFGSCIARVFNALH